MQEPHVEGPASHDDPESCADAREGAGEALTGAHAGEVSSREIRQSGEPTPLTEAEGHIDAGATASPQRSPRGRRPSACVETPRTGTGRSQGRPPPKATAGRVGKAGGRNPTMHGHGKSDAPVVPEKPPNKAAVQATEAVEGRGPAKGNAVEQSTPRTQSRTSVSSALERVRRVASLDRKARFTALAHHVTLDALKAAFGALRPNAAAGVDGVTWQEYEQDLERNLADLHGRLRRGAFRAKPSRRVFIPKPDGRQRPLGIASLEDKIVQRAVVGILNAIYETDFLGFSYGFRPGRRPHGALDALTVAISRKKVSWVLDADIRGFFDAIDHGWLMKFVEHRIGDRSILRLIQKWLNAGVLEDGAWTACEEGTPQGAVISPLLANVYLHYVLDLWARQWRSRVARGEVVIVRYADDFIVGFQHRSDAERFLLELRQRLAQFTLELHPEKTRLLEFGRFAAENRMRRGDGKPETFDFLGFTHVCAKTRKGAFQLKRKTVGKRMRAKLHEVKAELRTRMHLAVPEQGRWLGSVVRGYFAYHAVPGNVRSIAAFRTQVNRLWHRTLRRRSQRACLDWRRMTKLVARWIPPAKILHPWPEARFDAMTRGKSRVRE
jgi:RNA-directed DNA polymerase